MQYLGTTIENGKRYEMWWNDSANKLVLVFIEDIKEKGEDR